jgi:galactokinase
VLAVPLPEGVYVAWGIRPDRRVAVHALNAKGTDLFEPERATRSGRRWSDLARGVFAVLGAEGRRLPGLDLAVYGDLDARSGLASSAAYSTAILACALAATGRPMSPAEVARLVARVEREWAGVHCGYMDPYVAEVGTPGEVVRLDNRRLVHDAIPLPPGVRLVPVPTGIERRLSETPYNDRRQELQRALALVRTKAPGLESLVDLSIGRFEEISPSLPDPEVRRARHVVTEADRVQRGTEALRRQDAVLLGALLVECHESLSRDFECSTPEIDARVAAVRIEEGVLGARLQGAGWGGSLAVLRRDAQPTASPS